jgi:hypothetical protein
MAVFVNLTTGTRLNGGETMPSGLKTHLYTLCWNDARMLPFFFRHYDRFVDHYFIYDNGSTDETLAILAQRDNVTVTHFDTPGDSFVAEELRLSETMWQASRGAADFVFVLDLDEHVYRPDLLEYLKECRAKGITAIHAIGYDMVADGFPQTRGALHESVTLGVRSTGFDKLCVFNPDAIESSNFGPGRHTAEPAGRVVWPERVEILMLHFKQMGVDYPIARSAELRKGLGEGDITQKWGDHYSWSPAVIARAWARMREDATTVPGLGAYASVQPGDYDEEFVIRASGLVAEEWYLDRYPDVREAQNDPITHFCSHGWREGRLPNFYFDCDWYRETYPSSNIEPKNPLIHYIHFERTENLLPSTRFDSGWYRREYGLGDDENPLRHYLQNAASGRFAPVPDFDVRAYCRRHPAKKRRRVDPFEDFCVRESGEE